MEKEANKISNELTIKLSKSIYVHGEKTETLLIRKPNVGDIRKIGLPFSITQGSEIMMKPDIISHYIVSLCGVNMSAVDGLAIKDFLEIQNIIFSFFQ